MEFRILGSLAAVADGSVADLGSPKQRALLAILLLHVGDIVPVDRLIDLLWGEDAPRTAAHSIQIYISSLRHALAPIRAGELIVTRPPGYVLDADRESVDAWRFERLARDGARLLEHGELEGGRAALREALALWRGPVLSDFAYEEFAQAHIRRLGDARLDALETLAAAELEAGRPAEAIGLLAAAIQDDPLRERSRELLMLALYRSGRHAEALRTFDALRTQLADELGIEPSPRIRGVYDRILLHDPSLLPEPKAVPVTAPIGGPAARNPYKGLRAFTEADATDFFGRDDLVRQLLDMLASGARLISLVGPSGSGKSSVVAAGLVPRLREGAIPDSERWHVARIAAGGDVLRDAEAILARGAEGLLVIDQFEQIFTGTDEQQRDAFLGTLTAAVDTPDAPVRVVLTLRADFYDRPLLHSGFSAVFVPSVVNVVPMTPEELEAAIVEPARRVGVEIEPALLAELAAGTVDRPGSLPLLQYALTELFEQRTGSTLTHEAFTRLGGLRGLLSRRAEGLYIGLDAEAQAVAMQVFLRLVRPGSGDSESRRRATLAELTDLGVDALVLSKVLTTFGRQRLLTFDRNPATDRATVEVAHEALLTEWERLAGWIDRYRSDLRKHATLLAAADEWDASGRNSDYLFGGSRLEEFEPWLTRGVIELSGRERAFLTSAVDERQAAEAEACERQDSLRRRERSAIARVIVLVGAVFLLAAGLAYAVFVGFGTGAPTVALLTSGDVFDEFADPAFDEAIAEFELVGKKARADQANAAAELRRLSAEEPALVIVSPAFYPMEVALEYPEVQYLNLNDAFIDAPNVSNVVFRAGEGAFLAGVAAARTTETGMIGMVGAAEMVPIWWFHAGYQAGALAVDPDVQVEVIYLEEWPADGKSWTFAGFSDEGLVERAASQLYERGADVVFQVAGRAGLGAFEAAADLSDRLNRQLWAIGVDSDQYESVTRLPGVTRDEEWQHHILTSVLKRFDVVVHDSVAAVAAGEALPPIQVYDLESELVDITYSGGFIEEFRTEIEDYRRRIIEGDVLVPCIPDDRLPYLEDLAEEVGMSLEELLGFACP